jgi:STE24 endopeptidase
MTATRFMRGATLVAGVVLWLVAAWLLWRTRVPGDLQLPHLDPRAYFSDEQLRETERYERFLRILRVLGVAASLFALAVTARRGRRLARTIGLGRASTAIVLGLLALTAARAVSLPFALARWWWQRRHELVQGSPVDVLVARWETLAGDVVVAIVLVAVVVTFAARWPRSWWLRVVPVFAAVSLVFVSVQLALVPLGTHALKDAKLRADVRRLERIEGVRGTPVEVERVSRHTSQANAYAYKLGPLKRVVLWDTLLDGRFRDGEVRVVTAHELAHVAREHVLKWLGWFLLASVPSWWLVARAVDVRDPANVPYALLAIALLSLALTPIGNAVSRRYEAEADWVALEATKDPASARTLFQRFSTTSLAQPSPPHWAYLFFDDHPTLIQRIAMAEAWATRAAASRAGP